MEYFVLRLIPAAKILDTILTSPWVSFCSSSSSESSSPELSAAVLLFDFSLPVILD